ncbi:beta-lactamase family protein [Patescibacteria group bacterium]|nr:beta-lactamase family protein [Patescibacteria group bacterium]
MTKNKLVEKLRFYLEKESKVDNFSGTVLVAKNNEIIFEYFFGFANKRKRILNKIDTKFSLGSLNKMFTGIAILQLVEKGLLELDDTIDQYLPKDSNVNIKKGITIHHLLTHTSGLGHYTKDWNKLKNIRESLRSISDFIALFKNEPLLFKPGEKYQYSGNGYELLGAIIEVVTKQSYYNCIKKNIFKKANMSNSDFCEINKKDLKPNIAIGYKKNKKSFFTPSKEKPVNNLDINLVKGSAAGGAYSTVHDLFNFSKALFENTLLSNEMTTLAVTPKIKIETKGTQTLFCGYGFQIVDFGGNCTKIGHGGIFAGVNARLDIYKKLGYTVIVLSNYDRPTAFRVAAKAEELIIAG